MINNIQPVPYSEEAEVATIGAVLIYPEAFIGVAALLKVDDFFLLRHRYIWEAMQRLADRNEPIEYLLLANELKTTGHLDEIGGPAYLTQIMNSTPTHTHAEVYARLVERAATRRRLMAVADQIKALALNEELTIEQVTDTANKKLFDVTSSTGNAQVYTFHDMVHAYYDKVEALLSDGKGLTGLPTGFRVVDNLLGGLNRSDLLLLAGRPGMGKSSFLLSLIMNVQRAAAALKQPPKRIALFTLEMGCEQIIQRAMSLEAGINLQALRHGNLPPGGWSQFVRTAGAIAPYPIFVDDRADLTPTQMRAVIRKLTLGYGPLDLVIVDYLQLMSGGKSFKPSERVQEVSYISRALKNIAKEFDVPLLAASQLSRECEKRADKRPQLSDLRESGAQEQDADIVMFLYRDEVYNEATEFPNQAEIIVAKHRNGPTGTVTLYFEKTLTKFLNAAERSVDLLRLNGGEN